MVWAKGDGSTLNVFDTEIGRLGGIICWEHWMPLVRYAAYAQGMQISASVWPSTGGTSLTASKHMAFEGRCFVLLAGAYFLKSQVPADFELRDDIESVPDVIYPGGSTIIGPDGKCLIDPVYGREAIISATINLDRIIEEKNALDVVGHYSRPDVLRLWFNRQPAPHMVVSDTEKNGEML
jgi:nitrilase